MKVMGISIALPTNVVALTDVLVLCTSTDVAVLRLYLLLILHSSSLFFSLHESISCLFAIVKVNFFSSENLVIFMTFTRN